MITKEQIYQLIWLDFDLDSEDLPRAILSQWITEGWVKISRKTSSWPTFAAEATLPVVAGQQDYPLPLKQVISLEERSLWGSLRRIADETRAETLFPPPIVEGVPTHWTIWRGQIRLYPPPDTDAYDIEVRGYRAPLSPANIGDNDPIDLPHEDAEPLLVMWVRYRAYLRETEETLARFEREEFEAGLNGLNVDEQRSGEIVLNSLPSVLDYPTRLRYPFE